MIRNRIDKALVDQLLQQISQLQTVSNFKIWQFCRKTNSCKREWRIWSVKTVCRWGQCRRESSYWKTRLISCRPISTRHSTTTLATRSRPTLKGPCLSLPTWKWRRTRTLNGRSHSPSTPTITPVTMLTPWSPRMNRRRRIIDLGLKTRSMRKK